MFPSYKYEGVKNNSKKDKAKKKQKPDEHFVYQSGIFIADNGDRSRDGTAYDE